MSAIVTDEQARQSALLAALWPGASGRGGDATATALAGWLRIDAAVPAARGLQAYQLNAGASAERALAASFPVLQCLVGDAAFAGLARAYWQACPATRGDLAWAGAALPEFIATDVQLADLPYLADVARLEWQVARAEAAADDPRSAAERIASLQCLADTDPDDIALQLAPGAVLLASAWPVASLWCAHPAPEGGRPRDADPAALAHVRAMLAQGAGETAFVWRAGWRVQVAALDAPTAAFHAALLDGQPLSASLDRASTLAADWPFDAWLAQALHDGWLAGARRR